MSSLNPLEISVKCYAGYRGEETPRSIFFKNTEIQVVEIIDMWLAPDHRYFKFKGYDNGTYIIRYDNEKHLWELTFFTE